jgi:glutamate racemase
MKEKGCGPIGVFDSGYGGLTILDEIRKEMPEYDYIYLGDNARTPYGTRSFHVVYEFTLQAVRYLFNRGCPLVILACNTASAKALRTIQQHDLPLSADPSRRVLGHPAHCRGHRHPHPYGACGHPGHGGHHQERELSAGD